MRPSNHCSSRLACPGWTLPLQGFAATRHITIKGAAAQPSTAAADSGITCDVTSSQTTPAPVTSVPVTADVDAAAAAAAPASQSDPPAVSSTSSDVAPSTPSNSAATTAVLAAGGPSAAAGSGSDPASAGGAAKAKQAPQGRGGNQAGGSAAAVGPKGRGQTNGRGTGAAAAGRSRNGSQIPLADQLYAWCREVGLRCVTCASSATDVMSCTPRVAGLMHVGFLRGWLGGEQWVYVRLR